MTQHTKQRRYWESDKTGFSHGLGPFLDGNIDETVTVSADGTTGNVVLRASEPLWKDDHVGALWRLDQIDLSDVSQWVGAIEVTAGTRIYFAGIIYEAENDGTTSPNAPNHEEGTQADSSEINAVRWKYLHSGFGVVEITGVTNAQTVTAKVISTLPDSVVGNATADLESGTWRWREGAFSDAQGYPRDGTIWDTRLVLVGRGGRGNVHHLGRSQDLGDFLPGDEDDAAITRPLISERVPTILWLLPGRNLFIATAGREWIGRAGDNAPVATPSNYVTQETTSEGSVDVSGLEIDGRVVFFDRSGRTLLEHTFDLGSDAYETTDLSIRADHIARTPIRRMIWQKSPHRLLWCVFADGSLASVTYHRQQQVLAWAPMDMGGFVEDIATIPNATAGVDDLMLIIRRTIDGREVRSIERLALFFDPYTKAFTYGTQDEADRALWTHASIWFEGDETDTIGGLDHLEGQDVDIVSQGRYIARAPVNDGTVSLPVPVGSAIIGLPVRWTVSTLPYEVAGASETMGRVKQANGVVVDFLCGVDAHITVDDAAYAENVFPDAPQMIELGEGATGPRYTDIPNGDGFVCPITLTSDLPYPAAIRTIIPEMED